MENSITEIAYKVKNLGISSFHKRMEDQDLNTSREIVKNINCLKAEYQGIFETNIKFRLIDFFLKFKFKKFKYTNYFLNLSKKLCLKQIADEIFNTESRLERMDCYVSPISDKPTLEWHVDHAYSGMKNVTKYNSPEEQTIKFFFGLTDMTSDNGCLSYIPKSHIIAVALRKGIYEGTLKYTPYFFLDDFRKTILINDNYIYLKKNVSPNILNEFLEKTEPSIFKNESDFKYDYQPIKAGGALIFNDSGLHKGSRTKINERLVLRFFYRKKTNGSVGSNFVAPSNQN